jgi:hypothetical protein
MTMTVAPIAVTSARIFATCNVDAVQLGAAVRHR